MTPSLLPFRGRFVAFTIAVLMTLAFGIAWAADSSSLWLAIPFGVGLFLTCVGIHDFFQTKHSVLRNYPIMAHFRFIFEAIRPELRQYFFEGDKDGMPFSRDRRAVVYQRAKMALDVRPFGTTYNVYGDGFEWMAHSISPRPVGKESFRIMIGDVDCTKPYSASVFNISAMSFGALSANAIRALNGGAKRGGFAHDTGEGGYSPYHREGGGDIIWEIGSGYFGARNPDGTFSPEKFAAGAANEQVKMVELKLSQGAKPGHGGVLPAPKVSHEISLTRGVPMGEDCVSPSRHSAFSTPVEMMQFIAEMRRLSGGKPAGFKLCIGHEWEFLAICKAMLETGIYPDFIVVDGKEGGTGAAPMEFVDHVGKPMRQGLYFVHNALIGIGARHRIKLGAAGKIITAFDIVRSMALGADWCNSARGFMFAVGCIQSQSCHTDRCPTGVATQDPTRQRALVVPDKIERVFNFHRATLHELAELTAAAGLDHPSEFKPEHISRRISPSEVITFADLYPSLAEGELVAGSGNPRWRRPWDMAQAHSFRAVT
ncbi:MAG: FMN-binding glutamate synthase family protein [Reyranella sp.]|uniref:FMN-binding glutamate synthase family protein n=1 Tax=Reyranella sp. TaxID=1929291 RepID=UPI0012092408|nr:FMN-binding glutamate synthase family protein [Reyranella sp.]TAJ36569.1 MAG: FMN-binding glutamate synthase family protein [Reyranella sp.]